MSKLSSQLEKITNPKLFVEPKQYKNLLSKIKQDDLTRTENPESHFCVFFIPYNPKTKELFIVHHKKAKQWIVPGGHVEKGETLEEAVTREADEELGITIKHVPDPFMISIMEISNVGQLCRFHHDIWYIVPTEDKLNIDFREFNDVQWVNFSQAKHFITHPMYLQAINRIETSADV